MRNFIENPVTREEKIYWLSNQYNILKETSPEESMIVYRILKDNVINQQTNVLKLA